MRLSLIVFQNRDGETAQLFNTELPTRRTVVYQKKSFPLENEFTCLKFISWQFCACTLPTLTEGASTAWSFWLRPWLLSKLFLPLQPFQEVLVLLPCLFIAWSALALVASILRGFGVHSVQNHSSKKLLSLYPSGRPTKPGSSDHFLTCHRASEAVPHPQGVLGPFPACHFVPSLEALWDS